MQDKLIEYFTNIMPLTQEEIDAIIETINIQQYKKGTILQQEGKISDEAYFVLEGCVRQYHLIDGEEKIVNFFTEGQWVFNSKALGKEEPSSFYLDCCTDVTLVVGDIKKEESLYQNYPRLETVSRKVMEQSYTNQYEQMSSYQLDSPEERYLKILNSRPELLQLVPQYQIANFIGIKPESLSRIRKRMTKK